MVRLNTLSLQPTSRQPKTCCHYQQETDPQVLDKVVLRHVQGNIHLLAHLHNTVMKLKKKSAQKILHVQFPVPNFRLLYLSLRLYIQGLHPFFTSFLFCLPPNSISLRGNRICVPNRNRACFVINLNYRHFLKHNLTPKLLIKTGKHDFD